MSLESATVCMGVNHFGTGSGASPSESEFCVGDTNANCLPNFVRNTT